MKTRNYYLFLLLFIISCSKKNLPMPDPGSGTGSQSSGTSSKDSSHISASINGTPMLVTKILFSRGPGAFNFTAQNDLQKIDIYCFHFYEPNRWNYQYSDSINYSSRESPLSTWSTRRAINWGDVNFDCCAGPLEDKVISGNYSATFAGVETNIAINGVFHFIF